MLRREFLQGLAVAGPLACTPTLWAKAPTAVRAVNPKNYRISMTTTFVVPADNNEIDQLRVYHALPDPRPWSRTTEKYGAILLSTSPKGCKEELHKETNSHHLLWTLEGKLAAGKKFSFATVMNVWSADRDFKSASVKWTDFAKPPEDSTAVVDPAAAKEVHPELAKVAASFKKSLAPPAAVQAMCKWVFDNIKYDASVRYDFDDVASIVKHKRGHCGHQSTVFEQLTMAAGIPIRVVWGMNLYAPDGRTGELQKVRLDYTNIHTWAEVYFPGMGWIEADPGLGANCYQVLAQQIQNNRWFQNYSVWIREGGVEKIPTWSPTAGGFSSDYGVSHTISYNKLGK